MICSLPVTRCLIIFPDMKCANLSVIYTFCRLVCGRDLLKFNMSRTSGVGCLIIIILLSTDQMCGGDNAGDGLTCCILS